MKKILKASLAGVFAATMLSSSILPTVGAKKSVKADVGANLWTTHNSFIVLQDNADMKGNDLVSPAVLAQGEELKQTGLNVDMFRGETEGAQLIVTPESRVNAYTVSVSDLVNTADSSKKIESGNVEIFKQHYAPVKSNSPNDFAAGWYPDVMIPMEGVIKTKENFIEAGKNQGLTFEVKVEADEEKYPAGIYKGTITLTLDGAEQQIPLVVRVRDITIEKSYMISTAASAGWLSRAAYEMCLEYHVMPQYMPQAASSPDSFVKELRRYWNNPNFTNYEIPNYGSNAFYKYARAIAIACIEDEVNYFDRVVMYMQAVDEPHDGAYASSQIAPYTTAKNTLISDLRKAGYVVEGWLEEAIKTIPFLVANDNWVRALRAEHFDTKNQAISFANNGSLWRGEEVGEEYSSVVGDLPILTYNNSGYNMIGMTLPSLGAGMRNLGWACSQYDIDGHLWWDIDSAMLFNPPGAQNAYWVTDYYNDLNAFSDSFGHARMITPAKKYGKAEDWLPTLRLRNFRDGVDDFDLLYTLEKVYNDGLLKAHGIDAYDFDALMEWIYTKGVSSGAAYVPDDGHIVDEMRRNVMDLIELANSPVKFVNGGIKYNGVKANFSFWADADKVTVNGQVVSGLNNRYTYALDNLNTNANLVVVIEKGGKTYHFSAKAFEFGELKNAIDVSKVNAQNVENFAKSSPAGDTSATGVPAGTVAFDEASKKFTFVIESAYGYNQLDSIDYSPEFTFDESFFGVDNLFDIYYVTMKVRVKFTNDPIRSGDNKAVDSVPLAVNFVSRDGYSVTRFNSFMFGPAYETGDGWMERTLIFKMDRATVTDAKSLRLSFTGFHNDMFKMGATVEVSDIYFTLYQYKVQ